MSYNTHSHEEKDAEVYLLGRACVYYHRNVYKSFLRLVLMKLLNYVFYSALATISWFLSYIKYPSLYNNGFPEEVNVFIVSYCYMHTCILLGLHC